ncbi:MAG: hypothetical protein ACTHNH_11840 [Mesorhizobium sp.]
MVASEKELLEIEKGFWALGEAYFKAHADKECLVAFPEMAMAMSNADLAATAKNPNRWRDLSIDLKGMVEPGSDVVMLSYEAHATREGGEPYAALVSSGYVHRADGWKLMFHCQTPLAVDRGKKKR